jgi:ribose transport system ATP-binding protein
MAWDSDTLLEMSGIKKSFAGSPALSEGNLSVRRGEVHALVGQNGAGKSTMIKVLTGVYGADSGSIRFEGKDARFRSPHDAQCGGISPIYQEINLVPQRTVAENVFLGKEPKRFGLVDRRRMESDSEALLAKVGVRVDTRAPLESLSIATQQMVAIARALSFDAKLLIMDEPTSSLHDREVESLFASIRQLKASGVAVIFVSHKLDELYQICDRVTILRDGRTVATGAMGDFSRLDLVAAMLGRDPGKIRGVGQTAFARASRKAGEVLLETRSLSSRPLLKSASLTLRKGEILGIAGLLGSGRSEFAKALYGADRIDGGTAVLGGEPFAPASPAEALGRGIALTPEDRKTEGLVGIMSIRENMTLPLLPRLSRLGVIDKRKESGIVRKYMDLLQVKSSGPDQLVSQLSGGNQQKVLLARSLALEPSLLILDEPTRGVDVGAQAEIQALISESVDSGRGVILISSEMEEILEGSDRVHVLRDGESVADLDPSSATHAEIMNCMASANPAGADSGEEKQ